MSLFKRRSKPEPHNNSNGSRSDVDLDSTRPVASNLQFAAIDTGMRRNNREVLQNGVLILGIVASTLSFLGVLITLIFVARIANKPPATLVELANGTSIEVDVAATDERSPANIKRFVNDTILATLSAHPLEVKSPDGKTSYDEGVEVQTLDNRSAAVTKSAYAAALAAFDSGLFKATIGKIAELTPQDIFLNPTSSASVQIQYLGEPLPAKDGNGWTVTVNATRTVVQRLSDRPSARMKNTEITTYEWTVFVSPRFPLRKPKSFIESGDPIVVGIYNELKAYGMSIEKIEPRDSPNSSPSDTFIEKK